MDLFFYVLHASLLMKEKIWQSENFLPRFFLEEGHAWLKFFNFLLMFHHWNEKSSFSIFRLHEKNSFIFRQHSLHFFRTWRLKTKWKSAKLKPEPKTSRSRLKCLIIECKENVEKIRNLPYSVVSFVYFFAGCENK